MPTLLETIGIIDPNKAKELNDFLQQTTSTVKLIYAESSLDMNNLRKAEKVFKLLEDGYRPSNIISALETLRDAVTRTIEAERLLISVVEDINGFFGRNKHDHTNSDPGTNGS